MWPIIPRTMMIIEAEPLRNPIGFVHFKQRDERFVFIEMVIAAHYDALHSLGKKQAVQ